MSPAEARRAALIELGGVEQTKNRVRENLCRSSRLDALLRDTRYAFRTMRKQKTFTALAVLCLALGIGANTTIFSFMDSILFRALPVAAPDELVILQWTANRPTEDVPWGMPSRGDLVAVDSRLRSDSWPYPAFEIFEEHRELFTEVFGSQPVSQLRVDDGDGPTADGLYVTGDFFRSLGVGARAGRLLADDDDRFDAPPVAVLSSAFSAERFGSAEAAVGQTIRLNGVVFTVIGVTPPSFFGLDPERRPSFYLPLRTGPLLVAASPPLALPGGASTPFAATLVGNTLELYQFKSFYWISAWARLRPGVSRAQVEATLRPQFDRYFRGQRAQPGFVAQRAAARGCSGNDRSRRPAQELRRNSARAVRDGRRDSDGRLREHRELAARACDCEAARNGSTHEPRCGSLAASSGNC